MRSKLAKSRLTIERLERRDVLSFAAPTVFPAGLSPVDMVGGDFNADGLPDLAVLNAANPLSTVSVILNAGNGTFQPPKVFQTAGKNAQALEVADITGDGKLDLITANYGSDTVTVLRGSGTGVFRRPLTYAAGTRPSDVAVGDFNGDGNADIGVSNDYLQGVYGASILKGVGGGNFAPVVHINIETRGETIAAGDINNDGLDDIVAGGFLSQNNGLLVVLLGDGGGSAVVSGPVYTTNSPGDSTLADLNGDGKLDIATANHLPNAYDCSTCAKTIEVRLGAGDGSFGASTTYTVGAIPKDIDAADLDADGDLDLIVPSAHNSYEVYRVNVLFNHGDGSFFPPDFHAAGPFPVSTVTDDFDSDGIADVAVATGFVNETKGAIALITGLGNGAFNSGPLYSASVGLAGMASGDLNGDGLPDFVFSNSNAAPTGAAVFVVLNAGAGTFDPPVSYPAGTRPFAVTLADLNEDGILDILAAEGTVDGVTVLLGNGDGTFGNDIVYLSGGNARGIAAADFNGDGHIDAAVTNDNVTVGIVLGNGDGTLHSDTIYGLPYFFADLAAADFNGDGFPDIVTVDTGCCLYNMAVLINRGDGSFKPYVEYDTQLQSIAVGDVSGDGILDLIGGGTLGVSVLTGNADGTFNAPVTYLVGWQTDVEVGDFNADGMLDIVAVHPGGTGTFMINAGGGVFDTLFYVVGPEPRYITVDDYNADGAVDVGIGNTEGFGTGFGSFNPVSLVFNAADWGPAPISGGLRLDVAHGIAPQLITHDMHVQNRADRLSPVAHDAVGLEEHPSFSRGATPISAIARFVRPSTPVLVVCDFGLELALKEST